MNDEGIFLRSNVSYIVSINHSGSTYCIGALISYSHVITTASCIFSLPNTIRLRDVYIKPIRAPQTVHTNYFQRLVVTSNDLVLTVQGVDFAVVQVSESTHKILRTK